MNNIMKEKICPLRLAESDTLSGIQFRLTVNNGNIKCYVTPGHHGRGLGQTVLLNGDYSLCWIIEEKTTFKKADIPNLTKAEMKRITTGEFKPEEEIDIKHLTDKSGDCLVTNNSEIIVVTCGKTGGEKQLNPLLQMKVISFLDSLFSPVNIRKDAWPTRKSSQGKGVGNIKAEKVPSKFKSYPKFKHN